jgi:hypothetical protein
LTENPVRFASASNFVVSAARVDGVFLGALNPPLGTVGLVGGQAPLGRQLGKVRNASCFTPSQRPSLTPSRARCCRRSTHQMPITTVGENNSQCKR